jgi:pre-mRNA 3'-end-processing factor FIP1
LTDELIEEQNAANDMNNDDPTNGDEQADMLNKLANDSMNGTDRVDNEEDEDEDEDEDDDEDNVNIVISDIVNKPYSSTLQQPQAGSAVTAAPNASNPLTWQKGVTVKPGGPVGVAGGPPGTMVAGPGGAAGVKPAGPQAKGVDLEAPGTINDLPTYEYNLQEVNDEDKPWRKPGADITDYFNYGFNEETWIAYCMKQKRLRLENNPLKAGMMMPPMMAPNGMIMPGQQQQQLFPQNPSMPPQLSSNIPILNNQPGNTNQPMGGMLSQGGVVGMPNTSATQGQPPNNMPLLPGAGGPNNMPIPPAFQQQNPMMPPGQGGFQNRMPFQPRYPPPGQMMPQQPGMGPGGQYQQPNMRRGMGFGSDSNDNTL